MFIGFGSITKATLGLLVSARTFELSSVVVIAPQIEQHQPFVDLGVSFIDVALTPENLGGVLRDVVRQGISSSTCR